jgi:hypothetical protein
MRVQCIYAPHVSCTIAISPKVIAAKPALPKCPKVVPGLFVPTRASGFCRVIPPMFLFRCIRERDVPWPGQSYIYGESVSLTTNFVFLVSGLAHASDV